MKTAQGFDDDPGQFEKVYQAECDCGWLGQVFYEPIWADRESDTHQETHRDDDE
jgi:hypothetical protein